MLHSLLTDGPPTHPQQQPVLSEGTVQPMTSSAEHHKRAAEAVLGAEPVSLLTRLIAVQPFLIGGESCTPYIY